MSAVPGDFMRDPAKTDQPDAGGEEPASADAGASWWQWLAIGILVGCWLAEATWCMENGF